MNSEPTPRFRCAAIRPSGATDLRIIHAANADAARDRLIAAGLEPLTIEAIGPSLASELAARLREGLDRFRHIRPAAPGWGEKPLLTAAYVLATASITLMLGSWTLAFLTMWQTDRILRANAAPIARYHGRLANENARKSARPVMTEPGPTEILGRLAAILPSDTGLVETARDREGALQIVLDTSDPDQIRPILSGDPLFGSLKEVSQAQTIEGKMRVALSSAPR